MDLLEKFNPFYRMVFVSHTNIQSCNIMARIFTGLQIAGTILASESRIQENQNKCHVVLGSFSVIFFYRCDQIMKMKSLKTNKIQRNGTNNKPCSGFNAGLILVIKNQLRAGKKVIFCLGLKRLAYGYKIHFL